MERERKPETSSSSSSASISENNASSSSSSSSAAPSGTANGTGDDDDDNDNDANNIEWNIGTIGGVSGGGDSNNIFGGTPARDGEETDTDMEDDLAFSIPSSAGRRRQQQDSRGYAASDLSSDGFSDGMGDDNDMLLLSQERRDIGLPSSITLALGDERCVLANTALLSLI